MTQRWSYTFESSDPTGARIRAARDETEAAGDRPCSRAEWCTAATRTLQADGTWTREPALTYGTFCRADRTLIAVAVEALPDAYVRLSAALGTRVRGETDIRVPFGPSVPIRLDVDEVMRLVIDGVMTWHERLAQVAGLSMRETAWWRAVSLGPYAGSLLEPSCRVLGAHLDAVLCLQPVSMLRPSASPAARAVYGAEIVQVIGDTTLAVAGGAQAGNEFLRAEYLARAALGETDPQVTRLLGVVCANGSCSRMALRLADPPQREGDTAYFSQCMSCRHLMTESEYASWATRNARFWKSRVTPAQIAARNGMGEATARKILDAVAG